MFTIKALESQDFRATTVYFCKSPYLFLVCSSQYLSKTVQGRESGEPLTRPWLARLVCQCWPLSGTKGANNEHVSIGTGPESSRSWPGLINHVAFNITCPCDIVHVCLFVCVCVCVQHLPGKQWGMRGKPAGPVWCFEQRSGGNPGVQPSIWMLLRTVAAPKVLLQNTRRLSWKHEFLMAVTSFNDT